MEFDVAIVGAGVVGLSAALSMSERGCRVALFDQRAMHQMQKDRHRVYALNAASLAVLNRLGILSALPHTAHTPYSQMHVWVANSDAKIDFDARLLGKAQLGEIVLENKLIEALFEKCLQTSKVTFIPEAQIQTVHTHPTHIELIHEQSHYQAKWLMVADGPHSQLRQQLQIPITQWSYHQEALVTTVTTTLPHENTCYQIFTSEGPLAFLPLDHPNQCSIVWSASPEFIQSLLSASEPEFNQTLTEYFQHKLGDIKHIAPLVHFPLTMRHVKQYVSSQWMFLGDAAHTVHPMAGLGLNIGFADLTCWLKYFDEFKMEKLSRALRAYQRERKTEVWKIICMMDALKMLFSQPIAPIRVLRDLGLRTCNALPIIKRFLIAEAEME